ncbi:hypothetical protein [Neorickettsia findlayensis]|uniref:Uncharacterized protein n=1 Tax=Neorickettsia findlayensis TaxID=2686014 RepID=A0A6P1GAK5_9RICK|nr:hypothetical protein [Neorickettsia findlayensis]QHD65330.1 hypothetical protein GP480_02640 [Neorickettsia findlayensis]
MLGSGENGSNQDNGDLGNNQHTQDSGRGTQQDDPQPTGEEQGAVGGQQQDNPQSSDEEQGAVGGQQQDNPQPSDEEPGAVGGQQQQGAAGPPDDPIDRAALFVFNTAALTVEACDLAALGCELRFVFLVAAWAHLRHPLSRRIVRSLMERGGYMTSGQLAQAESRRSPASGNESLLADLLQLILSVFFVLYLLLGLYLAAGTITPIADQERDNSGDGPPQGPLQDPEVSEEERGIEFD